MLDNLPHDQAFSKLIVDQMDTYAQKCAGWHKALVSRSQSSAAGRRLKASAVWADYEEIEDLIAQLYQSQPGETSQTEKLVEREVKLLVQGLETDPLDQADMIQDKKSIISLCLMYTSMKWLATKTAQLRYISDRATNSARAESAKERHTQRWTVLSSSEPRSEGQPVYLPLSVEIAS